MDDSAEIYLDISVKMRERYWMYNMKKVSRNLSCDELYKFVKDIPELEKVNEEDIRRICMFVRINNPNHEDTTKYFDTHKRYEINLDDSRTKLVSVVNWPLEHPETL